jgi:CHAT domain-containing protein
VPAAFRDVTPNGEPAPLAAISAALPPGTVIFEYCVLDDATLVWVISRDRGIGWAKLPIERKKIESYSTRSQSGDRADFETVLLAQHDTLIATPMAVAVQMSGGNLPTRLVLIPDGPMHGLALSASRSNAGSRPYLVEQMPVEFAGSSTLYLLSLLRDEALRDDVHATALLIGDPAVSDAYGLGELPGARAEIDQLSEIYGKDAIVRVGEQATVAEFLALAKRSTIIHVAAHGLVNSRAPSHSALLLAPSANDSGALDAAELLNKLTLDRTRLIVLASCSSAGGLPVGPEGVTPLVRPLIAAGAPAVIGTLWPVSDATTVPLLVSFHREYRNGAGAAEALRKAQVEMLTAEPKWPAMTWAAFQVIGHASSPNASRETRQKEKPP